jgi:hypothetical protein
VQLVHKSHITFIKFLYKKVLAKNTVTPDNALKATDRELLHKPQTRKLAHQELWKMTS